MLLEDAVKLEVDSFHVQFALVIRKSYNQRVQLRATRDEKVEKKSGTTTPDEKWR